MNADPRQHLHHHQQQQKVTATTDDATPVRHHGPAATNVATAVVLGNRELWDVVTAFMTGYPYAVYVFLLTANTSNSTTDDASLSPRARLCEKSALHQALVGDLTRKGELPHLAIAAKSPEMLRILFRLSRRPQYKRDPRLQFAKVMRCAVLFNSVEMLEVYISELQSANPDNKWKYEPLLMQLALGRDDPSVDVLEWLRVHLPQSSVIRPPKERDLLRHTERGDLDVVRWLLKQNGRVTKCLLAEAAARQQIHMLRIFYEHSSRRCSIETLEFAAERGHLEVVKLIVENQTKKGMSQVAITAAARHGQYGVVKYLVESHATQLVAPCVIDCAAAGGYLDIVKYLHEHLSGGCCSAETIANAAAIGHLEMVKFLSENRTEGCAPDALDRAARNGHLEVVKFLHDKYHLQCTSSAMDEAAANGDTDLVKFLHHTCGTNCTTDAMDRAAENGHLEIIELLHFYRKEGCTANALNLAAMRGHIDVVVFLSEYRPECDIILGLKEAAVHRQLEILKFLVPKLKPGQSAYPALEAASQGWNRSEIVKFLCEHQDQHEATSFLEQAVAKSAHNVVHAVWQHCSLEQLNLAKKLALAQNKLEIAAIIAQGIQAVQQSE